MAGDQPSNECFLFGVFQFFQIDHLKVAPLGEIALFIEDVGNAAAHARRKIPSCTAKDNDAAARHVFATVIADTFDDGMRTAVPNAESLTGNPADECLAGRGSIKRYVSDDDVLFRFERCARRR